MPHRGPGVSAGSVEGCRPPGASRAIPFALADSLADGHCEGASAFAIALRSVGVLYGPTDY